MDDGIECVEHGVPTTVNIVWTVQFGIWGVQTTLWNGDGSGIGGRVLQNSIEDRMEFENRG